VPGKRGKIRRRSTVVRGYSGGEIEIDISYRFGLPAPTDGLPVGWKSSGNIPFEVQVLDVREND